MNATNEKNHRPDRCEAGPQEHPRGSSPPEETPRGLSGAPPEPCGGAPRVRSGRTVTSCGDGPPGSRTVSRRSRSRRLRHPVGPATARYDLPVTSARRALGRYGEDLAARHLTTVGMRILDRNWRCQVLVMQAATVSGEEVSQRAYGAVRARAWGRSRVWAGSGRRTPLWCPLPTVTAGRGRAAACAGPGAVQLSGAPRIQEPMWAPSTEPTVPSNQCADLSPLLYPFLYSLHAVSRVRYLDRTGSTPRVPSYSAPIQQAT